MSDQRKWTALLTGDQNGLIHQYGDKFHGSPDWYERVDVVPMSRLTELEAEVARLRDALVKLSAFKAWSMPDSYSDDAAEAMVEEIQDIALKALDGEG